MSAQRYTWRQWAKASLPLLAVLPAYCAGAAMGEGMSPFGWGVSGREVSPSSESHWSSRGDHTRRPLALRKEVDLITTSAELLLQPVVHVAEPVVVPAPVAVATAPRAGSGGPVIELPATTDAPVEDGRDRSRNLVELRLGPFATRTARGYMRHGELLVQLEAVGDLLELPYGDSGARFTLTLPGGRGTLSADALSLDVTTPRGTTRDALMLADQRHYVPLSLVSEALGVEARFDPEQQLVMVLPSSDLPAVRRVRRERARQQVSDEATRREPALSQAALVGKGWNGLTMDYDVSASSLEPNKVTAYDFDVASRLMDGTVSFGVRGTGQRGSTQVDGSWTRIWQDGTWLRQMRLGDGAGSGPRPALSRGLLLTNAPPYRPLVVEALPFAGSLEPGWSVEAYRNGQLVAFDSTGVAGRYEITLPIHYGENPVDFVAYGPLGEVRTFNRTFRALPNMLPSGSTEYAVSGGACRYDCASRGNGDLRVGVSRRITARGGLDFERREGNDYWTPYLGLVSTPFNAVGLELETVRNGFDRGTVRYEPNPGVRTTFDFVKYSDQAPLRRLGAPGRESDIRFSGRFSKRRDGSGLALETAAARFNDDNGRRTEARIGISAQQDNILLRPYVRTARNEYLGNNRRESFAGTELTLLPRPSLGSLFGSMWLRAEGEIGTDGKPELASITAMRSLITRVRVEGGYRWQRSSRGSTIWLGIVSELSVVRYSARAMSVIGGDNDRVDQSIGGSVVWDKYGDRFLFSAEPATDRTGVTGTVYLDVNADGRRQRGEPTLSGMRVLTPGHAILTDSLGRFQMWGLQAFEPVRFSVDTASLPDPHYIPSRAGVMVTPELGQLSVIEMPIDVGAILQGRLDLAPDAPPLNGSLRLILTSKETGEVRSVETFQDGSFYIMGVRPGDYRLTVDPEMLRIAGLTSEPIDVDVPVFAIPGTKPLRPKIRPLVISLYPVEVTDMAVGAGQ